MTWSGEKLGVGRLEIVEADPQTGISYTMRMEGMAPVHGDIRFVAKDAATEVTWHDRGELGYALRYLGPMLEGMLVDSFTKNLANLALRLEATKK
jgi:carbon monoxide dehydrogenase subunit G